MKIAKTFANLAALMLALGFSSGAGAQQKAPAQTLVQKPAQKPAPKMQASPEASAAPKQAKVPKAPKSSKAAPSKAAVPAPAGMVKTAAPMAEPEPMVSRRDPFSPLVSVPHAGGPGGHLPPGKAGLVVSTVRVDGALRSPNGMIAVVSNPEQRVYFVREGDHLYDGDVEKISLDGVTFKENSKDAFGKRVERLVTKRIYPSAGEQQ
jgi:hypothetical protein